MAGRKWQDVDDEQAEKIKKHLTHQGGQEQTVASMTEVWRVKFSDSTLTYYSSGTLYSTTSNSQDPAVEEAWIFIDKIAGSIFVEPSKKFLIGLDETGKGELVGHTHLAGVLLPQNLFNPLEKIVSVADTKKHHTFDYWDKIFKEITSFLRDGLRFIEEKIPPWHIDKYNINKIMDAVYQRILASFFRDIDISYSRIVIDDYGIGPTIGRFLNFLKKQGAEVIVAQKSDDIFLEARVASIIAKRGREAVLKTINENPNFTINGLPIGSGNAGDEKTVKWINAWHQSDRTWPWFIKKSFSTIRKTDGIEGKATKVAPPIREDLLANEFRKNLDEGKLDIRALSIVCQCGVTSKAVLFTLGESRSIVRCSSCRKSLDSLDFTLRYYCGFLVPDSNVINRGLLSRDLREGKFFEDFTILLPGIVRFECDTPGGKKEFKWLGRFGSIGRIRLKETGEFDTEKFKNLSTQERDDLVMQACINENALLLSADNQVKGLAVSRNIFTIFVP